MAETDEPPQHGGGSGLGKKIGPFPIGVWAVILGGAGGLIWFLRKKNSAGTDTANSAAGGSGEDVPTSLVPINEGLSESQFQALLDAINKLHGPASTTPPPIGGGPAPVTGHVPPPPKTTPGGGYKPPAGPTFITVPRGSGWSYSSIAKQYGHTWQELWAYQLKPGVRPSSTQSDLRKRGPDHALFGGSTVAIPPGWKKE